MYRELQEVRTTRLWREEERNGEREREGEMEERGREREGEREREREGGREREEKVYSKFPHSDSGQPLSEVGVLLFVVTRIFHFLERQTERESVCVCVYSAS